MREGLTKRGMEEHLRVMKMFLDFECGNSYMTYTFLKTYRTVYLKRVSFIIYKFYLNKPDSKKKTHCLSEIQIFTSYLICLFAKSEILSGKGVKEIPS